MGVDSKKLSERIRTRITNRLAQAGLDGVGRSELVDVADRNNYRRGAAVLDQMLADGEVQRINRKYRLAESEVPDFWFTPDPTPEPTPIVWQPEPLAPSPSFWDLEAQALEPSGFWS